MLAIACVVASLALFPLEIPLIIEWARQNFAIVSPWPETTKNYGEIEQK